MKQIERGFVSVGLGQLHYRRVGSGPPVLLLHPSPQSSAFSIPMAMRLAENFTAIAVDTPGYGLSDPLRGRPAAPALQDYLTPLREFLDALGIEKVALYGNATGAEIAHLFAYEYPQRVALCMIDTAGHRADSELDQTLDGYFPDTTPRRDGGYLQAHWDMVRSLSLFSPWQKLTQAQRLDVDLPDAVVIQQKLLDYLHAGQHYAAAYRPAFYTAKHELISRVRVPATLTRWVSKPDLTEVDDLIARGLPPNFTVLHAGAGLDARLGVAEQHLLTHYLPSASPAPAAPAQFDAALPRLQSEFRSVRGQRVLLRRCGVGRGLPILALHDLFDSSRQFAEVLAPAVGQRPLLCVDLPGSGESAPDPEGISVERDAAMLRDLLDQLGIEAVEVWAWGCGAQQAIELAALVPQRIRRIVQLGPLYLGQAAQLLRAGMAELGLTPRWDGSHLATAWALVRDAQLFFPWCDRTRRGILHRDVKLDPVMLDRQVLDLLKLADRVQSRSAVALDYPSLQRAATLQTPYTLADRAGNALSDECASLLMQAMPHAGRVALDADPAHWWSALGPLSE